MAKKAKTVGQLMAALLKANPGEVAAIFWSDEDKRYYVDFGTDSTFGPKLYGSFKRLGQRSLAAKDAATAKLRGRLGQ